MFSVWPEARTEAGVSCRGLHRATHASSHHWGAVLEPFGMTSCEAVVPSADARSQTAVERSQRTHEPQRYQPAGRMLSSSSEGLTRR